MKKILFAVITVVSLVSNSFAGLLIDPYVGVGQLKSTLDIASNSDDESGTSSVVGSRLGYSFLLLSAGVDFEMVKSKLGDDDTDVTNTSFFVGVDMPILVRAWAEYFVNSKFELDGDKDYEFEFKDGFGVGLGFTGLPFVSINLELQTLNYETELSSFKGDLKTASTVLSVSLPLDL